MDIILKWLCCGKRGTNGTDMSDFPALPGRHFRGGVSQILKNMHYLEDEYYLVIIDREIYDRTEQERMRRAAALGRIKEPVVQEKILIPTVFHTKPMEQTFDDPFLQAEYAYSLIESEG